VTAALTWHAAAANVAAFVSLWSLAYVLPQALKEGIDARRVTRWACAGFLLVGGLNRLSTVADTPLTWWVDVFQYLQPALVVAFTLSLILDTVRAVRCYKEALEMVYDELGEQIGDRVAAIFRAVRGR
jgi:hypothetical protein